SQQRNCKYLSDELNENSGGDQGIYNDTEREEAAGNRDDPDDDQRYIWKVLFRVNVAKELKEITILSGRIRNPGIAQQQRKQRSECRPQHHRRENRRYFRSVDFFHKRRYNEIGTGPHAIRHKFAPGHYSDYRKVDRKVDCRYSQHANDYRAWYDPPRIFDFITDIADIVVTKVIINTDSSRGAQPK